MSRGTIAKHELTTGFKWGARLESLAGGGNDHGTADYKRGNGRFSVSYVTGSHSFKTGLTLRTVNNHSATDDNILANPFSYQLVNGVPNRITQWAAPQFRSYYETQLGLYAQDQWTVDRMTINAGLRFDYVNGTGRAASNPGGPFRAPGDFPSKSDIPNWKDVSPRLGVAYDLFGDGKTAVKVSIGKYLANENAGTTSANTPSGLVAQSATRSWNDANGNRAPDCGQQLCGLFDITPAARVRPGDTFVTLLENVGGDRSQVYNGFDFGVNSRLGGGRMLQGGISFGRTVTQNCFVVDSPQQARDGFCRVEPPWWGQTGQVTIAGGVPTAGGGDAQRHVPEHQHV